MGSNLNVYGAGYLAYLLAFWAFAVTVFWMVVGWRAMKAHEKIAEFIERSPIKSNLEDRRG